MKVCSVCGRCYEDSALSCVEDNAALDCSTDGYGRDSVPNYLLERRIESSPLGDVYQATQLILKKTYVVRVFATETQRAVLADARKFSAIIHPGVARVFESGTLASGPGYVVSEFFDGQTLRECLTGVGAPDEVTAVMIARQLAEALEAIHAVGLAHRSLRPENVLMTKDADGAFQVKLLNADLGGAFETGVRANGDLYLPALQYFSPEQCSGDDGDAHADLYALGVILHELLAGRVPFDSPYADALIAKHLGEPPPALKIDRFDIRMLLTHTVSDALQKTTRLRIKSANAFARRLRHIEQLATHSSTPPPVVTHHSAKPTPTITFAAKPKIEAPPMQIIVPERPPVVEEIAAQAEVLMPEPVAEPIIETFFEPVSEPIIEAIAEPIAEPIIEAVVEPITEPISEPFNEPIAEPLMAAPVTQQEIVVPAELFAAVMADEPKSYDTQKLRREPVFEVIYPDLSTTKLPPIEKVIEKVAAAPVVATGIESFGKLKKSYDRSGQPVLVAWEQPDDVPTTTQALGKKRKELADAAFAKAIAKFLKDEEAAASMQVEEAPAPSFEPIEQQIVVTPASTLFRFDEPKASWKMPQSRTIAAGIGLVVLVVLSVSALFVGRSIWASNRERPVIIVPKTNPAPVVEPERVAIVERKTEVAPVAETIEEPLPEFKPREATTKPAPVVQRKKAKTVKPETEKTEPVAVFGKTGEPEKPTSATTRPRIVKVPK